MGTARLLVFAFGESLGTRSTGACIRSETERLLQDHDAVEVDFSGVQSLSHSCADEAFAKLISEMGVGTAKARLKFRNMAEEVEAMLRFAIAERLRGTSAKSQDLCAAGR